MAVALVASQTAAVEVRPAGYLSHRPSALNLQILIVPSKCIYILCMIITVRNDYCPIQQ